MKKYILVSLFLLVSCQGNGGNNNPMISLSNALGYSTPSQRQEWALEIYSGQVKKEDKFTSHPLTPACLDKAKMEACRSIFAGLQSGEL